MSSCGRSLALVVLVVSGCGSIVSEPLSTAPRNASSEFPCDRYGTTPVGAVAKEGRCEIQGRPTYDFLMVVHVPDTAHYAAGHTFVLSSADLDPSKPLSDPRCAPPCLTLPPLGNVRGGYTVTEAVSASVGYPLASGTSIPVRATYLPVGRGATDTFEASLPLDVLFATSTLIDLDGRPTVAYFRSLPVGRWTRVLEPQSPFDEIFPPRIDGLQLTRGGDVLDVVDIGGASGELDDPGGTSRDAVVRRVEGLDGWKVWLEDHVSGRRISVVASLSGVEARPRLETTGRGTSLEGVDAVVAPPPGFLAVPRLLTPLIAGTGLQSLDYPVLRSPLALEGIVASGADGGVFLAVPSRVTFSSVSILLPSGEAQPLLSYATTVSTDDRGRFATVLPPGTYDVTVEPATETGFASLRQQIVLQDDAPITLVPVRRTRLSGVVKLTDGRPLSRATILAEAEAGVADGAPRPRPGRARTDDQGAFALELDRGPYVLTVVPEEGTGFPRIVTRRTVAVTDVDVGVLLVPPPTPLSIELRDPSNLLRPMEGVRLRVFATPETEPGAPLVSPVEIGDAVTDLAGKAEILLTQRPR